MRVFATSLTSLSHHSTNPFTQVTMSLHVLTPSLHLSRRCLAMSPWTVHTTYLHQRF